MMPTTIAETPQVLEKPQFILTGRMVLVTLVLFFAVIAAVNAVMMSLAIQTMPGTVTSSAYQSSQRFNKTLAEAKSRDALGWQVSARVTRETDRARILVTVGEVKGFSASQMVVKAQLLRPAFTGNKVAVTLEPASDGQFTGLDRIEGAGAFDLLLDISVGNETVYRSSNRIMIP